MTSKKLSNNFWPLTDDLSCLGTNQKWFSNFCCNAIILKSGLISGRNKNVWCAVFPIPLWFFPIFFQILNDDQFKNFLRPKKANKNFGLRKKSMIDKRIERLCTQNDTTFRRLCNRRVTSNGPSKILGWEIDEIFWSNYSQITKKLIGFLKISKSSTKNFLETIKNGADSTFRTT